jgi:hypothetical protein
MGSSIAPANAWNGGSPLQCLSMKPYSVMTMSINRPVVESSTSRRPGIV